SRVALLPRRTSVRRPGDVHVPEPGLQTRTAVASSRRAALVSPPATTIREADTPVHTGLKRVTGMSPAVLNAPVAGSNSSVATHGVRVGERPPKTSTRPSESTAAPWSTRAL